MTKEEREIIELKFQGLKAEITTNHDMQMQKLETILTQAMKTNGRVTDLEKETKTVRMFERKPVLLILFILGIIFLLSVFDLPTIIKLLA